MRRVAHYHMQEFMNSMCGYIESYEFYNEGIVKELETKIKEYTGSKYALCVNSATNALFMCLYLISKEKDPKKNEVIIPNYGFPAASRVCNFLGLVPIPVDIEKETISITPKSVQSAFSPLTMAYINVETNGIVGYAESLKGLDSNIVYIEDAAPSMLQEYKGKKAGTFGDVGIYSFSPTKPMCSGEGAVIITDREDLYDGLKKIRYSDHLSSDISLNFNMSPFLAAYLIPQFESLDIVIGVREQLHSDYREHLKIFSQDDVTNRYGSIMYLSDKAEKISKKLTQFGIEHRYKHYPLYRHSNTMLNSIDIYNKIIDLPMHHNMKYTDVTAVCRIIKGVEDE